MADWDTVRKGLAKVIRGQVNGLRVYEYRPHSTLHYPCLIIDSVGDIAHNPILQMGGFQAGLVCLLRVQSSVRDQAMKALEEYRWPNGSKSLFAAVNTDNTLDGSVLHGWVVSTTEPENDPDQGEAERPNEWQSRVIIQVTHAVN